MATPTINNLFGTVTDSEFQFLGKYNDLVRLLLQSGAGSHAVLVRYFVKGEQEDPTLTFVRQSNGTYVATLTLFDFSGLSSPAVVSKTEGLFQEKISGSLSMSVGVPAGNRGTWDDFTLQVNKKGIKSDDTEYFIESTRFSDIDFNVLGDYTFTANETAAYPPSADEIADSITQDGSMVLEFILTPNDSTAAAPDGNDIEVSCTGKLFYSQWQEIADTVYSTELITDIQTWLAEQAGTGTGGSNFTGYTLRSVSGGVATFKNSDDQTLLIDQRSFQTASDVTTAITNALLVYYTKEEVDTLLTALGTRVTALENAGGGTSDLELASNTEYADGNAEKAASPAQVQGSIDTLETSIATKANTSSLNTEIAARQEGDRLLQAQVDGKASTVALQTEQTSRTNEDARISGLLDDEVRARTNADSTLTTDLNNEKTAREAKDTALQTAVDSKAEQSALAAEITARTSADAAIVASHQKAFVDYEYNSDDHTIVFTHLDGTDGMPIDLSTYAIEGITYDEATNSLIITEESGSTHRVILGELLLPDGSIGEAKLNTALAAKINGKADQSALTSEASTREDADSALGDRIESEIATRRTADTGLQSEIDAAEARIGVLETAPASVVVATNAEYTAGTSTTKPPSVAQVAGTHTALGGRITTLEEADGATEVIDEYVIPAVIEDSTTFINTDWSSRYEPPRTFLTDYTYRGGSSIERTIYDFTVSAYWNQDFIDLLSDSDGMSPAGSLDPEDSVVTNEDGDTFPILAIVGWRRSRGFYRYGNLQGSLTYSYGFHIVVDDGGDATLAHPFKAGSSISIGGAVVPYASTSGIPGATYTARTYSFNVTQRYSGGQLFSKVTRVPPEPLKTYIFLDGHAEVPANHYPVADSVGKVGYTLDVGDSGKRFIRYIRVDSKWVPVSSLGADPSVTEVENPTTTQTALGLDTAIMNGVLVITCTLPTGLSITETIPGKILSLGISADNSTRAGSSYDLYYRDRSGSTSYTVSVSYSASRDLTMGRISLGGTYSNFKLYSVSGLLGGGGEVSGEPSSFISLPDTPADYSDAADKWMKVKSDRSGIEFVDAPTGGSDLFTGPYNGGTTYTNKQIFSFRGNLFEVDAVSWKGSTQTPVFSDTTYEQYIRTQSHGTEPLRLLVAGVDLLPDEFIDNTIPGSKIKDESIAHNKLDPPIQPVLSVAAPIKDKSVPIWHSPRAIKGLEALNLSQIIAAVEDSSNANHALFTERQAGSFISAANYRSPTVETFSVSNPGIADQNEKALVLHWPGNIYTNFQEINVQLDEAISFTDKSHNTFLSSIANGFDWRITDGLAYTDARKHELKVRAIYDADNDETLIKIHQHNSLAANPQTIFLFTLSLIGRTAEGVKGEKGDKGDDGADGRTPNLRGNTSKPIFLNKNWAAANPNVTPWVFNSSGTSYLAVGDRQPTPTSSVTAFNGIDVAMFISDYDKLLGIEIGVSHATQVTPATLATIYVADIDAGGVFVANAAGHAGNWRATTVQLFKNQNQVGSASNLTHRLRLDCPAGDQYIGFIKLILPAS